MNKKSARRLLNKILNNVATAQETTELLEYILRRQIAPNKSIYGNFEYVEMSDENYLEDDEVYAQVAIQEDGPGAYLGGHFPSHTWLEIQSISPVSKDIFRQAKRLKTVLREMADALDTVETEPEEVKFSSDEEQIPFDKDMPF